MLKILGTFGIMAMLAAMLTATYQPALERIKKLTSPVTAMLTALHAYLIAPATRMITTVVGATAFVVAAIGAIASLSMLTFHEKHPAHAFDGGRQGDVTPLQEELGSDSVHAGHGRDPALAYQIPHRRQREAA